MPNDLPAPIDTNYEAHGNLYGSFPFSQPIRIVSTGEVSHGELRVFGPSNGFSQDSFIYLPGDGYVGTDSFTYHACDSSGNCVDGTVDINVVNSRPNAVDDHIFKYELSNLAPDVSDARPSIATLWPPNHQMVEVSVLGVTDPDCDPVTLTITRITQNEPTNDTGDGDTCPDALGLDKSSAQMRAERSGTGTGRVYTIYFTATDTKGGASHGSVKIIVPKSNQGIGVDGGPVFDSTVCSP